MLTCLQAWPDLWILVPAQACGVTTTWQCGCRAGNSRLPFSSLSSLESCPELPPAVLLAGLDVISCPIPLGIQLGLPFGVSSCLGSWVSHDETPRGL